VFKARKRPAESADPDRGSTAVEDAPPPAPAAQRTEPVDSEPARSEPARNEPVKTEAPATEAPKTEAPPGEPSKTEQRTARPVAEKKPPRQRVEREDRQTGKKIVAGANAVRSRIASLVWLLAVICALFLAIGALLVALKANRHNSVVSFMLGGADKLDLGVFSRKDGIFTFHGKDAAIKDALVNWGIGAIVYLVVGKFVDRVIRP
jgi:hypothetical protein